MLLFHGTDIESATAILKEGFFLNECSDYGKAVYFTHDKEVALTYGKSIITAEFNGNMLNLQNPDHFEIYKQHPNEKIQEVGYYGLKDNYIIAIYNPSFISIKNILNN